MKLLRKGELFAEYSLGNARIFSLSDGHAIMSSDRLVYQKSQAANLAYEFPLPVQAFLVQNEGTHVLIDTGSSNAWRATTGRLYDAFEEASISREAIETIAITHCHVDHFSGLIMPGGQIAFPNANRIFVPTNEHHLFMEELRLAPMFDALLPLNDGDMVVDGIHAVALFGHEVGHTGFWVENSAERLLIWGDIVHKPDVQFADPEVAWEFDTDKACARQTRKKTLAMVSNHGVPVAGAHLDFPGVGIVLASGNSFAFRNLV